MITDSSGFFFLGDNNSDSSECERVRVPWASALARVISCEWLKREYVGKWVSSRSVSIILFSLIQQLGT